MEDERTLDPKLPLLQNTDIQDRIVLIRFDHNVVKNGRIQDPFRIDQTIGTIYNVVERGGRPIMMTHVGRPRDKKTGRIDVSDDTSVKPIVEYLERKLHTRLFIPEFRPDGDHGIPGIDTSINMAIKRLRSREIGGIYLPNTRWFTGEESSGIERKELAVQMAGLADVFVNDAFGSWQPHASTFDVANHLPGCAGYLLQHEIANLNKVLIPARPFVAVVAGSKFTTKIEPLYSIYDKVDHLILGGVIYNTYLCAKYGINVKGVEEEDVAAAKKLIELDRGRGKIVELPLFYESDTMEGKVEGKYRVRNIKHLTEGDQLNYILDIASGSFDDENVERVLDCARTIFVNAVMGYTPHFTEGSQALDNRIDRNADAVKLYGGGDTLQEFKNLCPGLYLSVQDDSSYYFFTGGGTVLKAIELGSPYLLEPVKALIVK